MKKCGNEVHPIAKMKRYMDDKSKISCLFCMWIYYYKGSLFQRLPKNIKNQNAIVITIVPVLENGGVVTVLHLVLVQRHVEIPTVKQPVNDPDSQCILRNYSHKTLLFQWEISENRNTSSPHTMITVLTIQNIIVHFWSIEATA